MGRGATRVTERVGTSLKTTEKIPSIQFENNKDISKGGVLLALPALLSNGLLKNIDNIFTIPKGFYNIISFFLLFAFSALMRIKSVEAIKRTSPGEFGKILGLDRIPEIRTIREKLNIIVNYKNVKMWSEELSQIWLKQIKTDDKEVYYIDGHIKVYNGNLAHLPKKYKAQKRLCVSGITEYWVNDKVGQPYFYISQIIDEGLIKALKNEIIPRLLTEVPNQPDEKYFQQDKKIYRFGIVFDREGYSPKLMKELWDNYRISCYTYKKYVKDKWDESEFKEYTIPTKYGQDIKMKLAEKIYYYEKLKIREVRKLSENSSHQTSIITTDYINEMDKIAVRMFSRWSQENFFKYMAENYGIDSLIEYSKEELNETKKVKNPAYKEIENQIRKLNGQLTQKQKKFAAAILPDLNEENKQIKEILNTEKIKLFEGIKNLEKDIEILKEEKKITDKHIKLSEMPKEKKFSGLVRKKKHFMDLIKMIAYRAETSMSNILSEELKNSKESRSILKQLFTADADLKINESNNTLEVAIHNLNNVRTDRAVQKLCDILNETETIFPDTNLKIFYKLVSN